MMVESRALVGTGDRRDKLSILVIAYPNRFIPRQSTNACGEEQDATVRKHMHCGFALSARTLVDHSRRLDGVRVRCQCRNQSWIWTP